MLTISILVLVATVVAVNSRPNTIPRQLIRSGRGPVAGNVDTTALLLNDLLKYQPQQPQQDPAQPMTDSELGTSLARELFTLQQEIDKLNLTSQIPESQRPKRTLQMINRLFCSVFRTTLPFCTNNRASSLSDSIGTAPGSSSGESTTDEDDNFWLDYLNSNTTTTTTTARPIFGSLAWKQARLRALFPRLFGWFGRSGSNSDSGGFLLNLLSAPLRALRGFGQMFLGGGAGRSGSGSGSGF